FAVRRVLRTLRPSVVVIAETEIWPNIFREAKHLGAGLIIVNGRISDRAFARYSNWDRFFRPILAQVDIAMAQSDEIASRFAKLGALPGRVQSGGNFKYDFNPAAAAMSPAIRDFLARTHPGKVWIAASTMPPADPQDPDEDEAVISAF